jgi:hypothetical protein
MPPDQPRPATKPAADELASYFEHGLVVYTAAFHLNRGSCCGSGCRHRPYDPKHVEGNQVVQTVCQRLPS